MNYQQKAGSLAARDTSFVTLLSGFDDCGHGWAPANTEYLSEMAIFSTVKSGGPCVDLGLDVLQSPHDSSTPASGARQEAKIASLIWTFEAAVDPLALCVRALLPEGW